MVWGGSAERRSDTLHAVDGRTGAPERVSEERALQQILVTSTRHHCVAAAAGGRASGLQQRRASSQGFTSFHMLA